MLESTLLHAIAEADRADVSLSIAMLYEETPPNVRKRLQEAGGCVAGVRRCLARMVVGDHRDERPDRPHKGARFDDFSILPCVRFDDGSGEYVVAYPNDPAAREVMENENDPSAKELFWSLYGVDYQSDTPHFCVGDLRSREAAEQTLGAIRSGVANHAYNAMCAWEWWLEEGYDRFGQIFEGQHAAREYFQSIAPQLEMAWQIARRHGYEDCFDWEFVPEFLSAAISAEWSGLCPDWPDIAKKIAAGMHRKPTTRRMNMRKMVNEVKRLIYAPALEIYKRPVEAVDHERGEVFEKESPELDAREREECQTLVSEIAALTASILAQRAGEFLPDEFDEDELAESLADALTEAFV